MNRRSILFSAIVLLGVAVANGPASALTGAEVLNEMNDDERHGYLAGNIDMAAQLSYHDGKRERSNCIFDWYYKKGGINHVLQAIEGLKDRQVQPVIYVLINRACGE